MTKFWFFYALVAVSILSACSDPSIIIHESSEKSESSSHLANCTEAKPCADKDGIRVWYSQAVIEGEQAFEIMMEVQPHMLVNSATLSGETMNMGYIPVFFTPLSATRYKANAMVGLCSNELMQWRLNIELESASDNTISKMFPLYVTR
ncbi:hypothetical protein [Pseudoalteromonas byunsanensis]|uniref:Lipoprotein n=1 Tax=Pseudoalteromonas byunsanensis TaxID=327939 RepID=A0A1S1NFK0_9GAMM|nr:hypothetical protein [Pseudoalteromonas byunsanensis]OHU97233.1 hypothetical protein BIW53_02645 [Pseudoalteromonas byunsanensis]